MAAGYAVADKGNATTKPLWMHVIDSMAFTQGGREASWDKLSKASADANAARLRDESLSY